MELTHDQLAAARARGCVFSPATEEQVRRFAMQRRVFLVGGEPCVAVRVGFFETHGTLAALIEDHRAAAPGEVASIASPVPSSVTPGDTEAPAAVLGEAGVPGEQGRGTDAPPAKARKARAQRMKSPPTSPEAATADEAAAQPSEAEEMLAGVAAAQTSAPGARVVRRRRAGQPPTPRWVAAGKARRGRLK